MGTEIFGIQKSRVGSGYITFRPVQFQTLPFRQPIAFSAFRNFALN